MQDSRYLEYGEREIAHLKAKDPALGKVMDEVGYVNREIRPDMFASLVKSIIGQQISSKAQITVWERMCTSFKPLTPENIASIPTATLQTCGISMKKATYINEIAVNIVDGRLNLSELHSMDDETVCRRLSEIKGIGTWTAEMLMIFSMRRMDILSWGDLSIQRGLRMLYRHRKITPALFAKYKKRYSPYGTVAGIYLWELAGGACKGYTDPAPKTEAQKKAAARARKKSLPDRKD